MLKIQAHAKVNLTLDVFEAEASGYHKMQSLLYELPDLFDELTIEESGELPPGSIELVCETPGVPTHREGSPLLRAAHELRELTQGARPIRLTLKKKIPIAAGLGGGSSDTAAALRGLAQLWSIPCCSLASPLARPHDPDCLLVKIAARHGMDAPFFLVGGAALATHYGEEVMPLSSDLHGLKIRVVETGLASPTAEAYRLLDGLPHGREASSTEAALAALKAGDRESLKHSLHNDFEPAIFAAFPALEYRKKELERGGAIVMLAGSGGALLVID
ncbi:hypothetical protein CO046_01450 [Candidatus Peregrinibacteria bacterium CG_4_9_14_0_2_um_filter_53_11]|nr:MAG: hypothetical protein CO046_01450 [Candidatus Peregrinibacteria bacterium CG_4_9_14_0_2_um_filter_53_11]